MIELKRLKLINWHNFENVTFDCARLTYMIGVNAVGKTTILDAIRYCLTTNRNFNALGNKKSGRTLQGSVHAKQRGENAYRRPGHTVAYIGAEFWDSVKRTPFVIAVRVESEGPMQELHPGDQTWYLSEDGCTLEQLPFIDPKTGAPSAKEDFKPATGRLSYTRSPSEARDRICRALGIGRASSPLGKKFNEVFQMGTSMDVFIKRTKMINAIRQFYTEMGCLEVETPVLQAIPGGASARPFITHHNALDIPFYLRIANELYLKRLIVGGFNGVFEFSRNFRNEGMDRTHNPEFTCMEVYVPYKDYLWMMDSTERMIEAAAMAVNGTTKAPFGENEVDFKRPFKRVRMSEAIQEYTGFDITGKSEDEIRAFCLSIGLNVDETMGKGKLIDEIFGEKCESHYIQPTFIYDYPVEMSPLTKMHRSDPGLTERFELFVNGKEVANAYSELNDPIDQLNRFKDQLALQERGDDEAMFIDYDFVRALEYGMPPTSGMGIGIDRLCMFLTNSPSIQDVLLFPQMKPEKVATVDADEKFIELGIPADWVAVVRKAGYQTVETLKAVENPNKLHQELSGLNKKMKLGLKTLSPDEVKSWIK